MHVRFEMRRALRIPMELVAGDWDEPVMLRTEDLSPRGCFVQAGVLIDPGTPVVVSFRLRDTEPEYTLFGEVTRVQVTRRRSDAGEGGFGIRFRGLGAMERLRIRERLRGVPPPLPVSTRVAA